MLNNSPNALYGRNVLTLLSSTTFRNHSVQPSEEDELDPFSRLDSSCLIFFPNVCVYRFNLVKNKATKQGNLHAKNETFCDPIRSMKYFEIIQNFIALKACFETFSGPSPSMKKTVYELSPSMINSKFYSFKSLLSKPLKYSQTILVHEINLNFLKLFVA